MFRAQDDTITGRRLAPGPVETAESHAATLGDTLPVSSQVPLADACRFGPAVRERVRKRPFGHVLLDIAAQKV
jgi:hypothetical protein